MLRDQEKNKATWHYRTHTETTMEQAGHIASRKDNRWTKRCTEWQPRRGKRSRGWASRRWQDDKAKEGTAWNRSCCCCLLNVPATCECISGTDLLNFTCCHTEIEVADPTFDLTQSQYTDTGLTSSSTDPIMPGAWQGSHWSANVSVTGMTQPKKIPVQTGFEPGIFHSRGGRLNH